MTLKEAIKNAINSFEFGKSDMVCSMKIATCYQNDIQTEFYQNYYQIYGVPTYIDIESASKGIMLPSAECSLDKATLIALLEIRYPEMGTSVSDKIATFLYKHDDCELALAIGMRPRYFGYGGVPFVEYFPADFDFPSLGGADSMALPLAVAIIPGSLYGLFQYQNSDGRSIFVIIGSHRSGVIGAALKNSMTNRANSNEYDGLISTTLCLNRTGYEVPLTKGDSNVVIEDPSEALSAFVDFIETAASTAKGCFVVTA